MTTCPTSWPSPGASTRSASGPAASCSARCCWSLGVVAIAFAARDHPGDRRSSTQQRSPSTSAATDLGADPVATLDAILNAPTGTGTTGDRAPTRLRRHAVPDLAAARAA